MLTSSLIGILKVMPNALRTIDRKHLTFDKIRYQSRSLKGQMSTVKCQLSKCGFTLVELLVVITIFVLASTLVLAGYLTFERNQRLKNAASQLKGDIRFTQNKALTGDKLDVGVCGGTTVLAGWYVRFQMSSSSSYTINGDYLCGAVETIFGSRTFVFPKGVTLSNITYGTNTTATEANIFFRPLSEVVSFHSAMPSPDFLDDSTGNLRALLSGGGSELVIELVAEQVSGRYQVRIRPTGEVYEQFIP